MKLPVKFDEVLLPKEGTDLKKWSVVACDQYTSQPEYWEELASYINEEKSTLSLIFPEVYLGKKPKARIKKIVESMKSYIEEDIFRSVDNGLILVERTTPTGTKRYGLTMLVDLQQYSYNPKDKALIRATEGTVVERIPPRVAIRKDCPLELPHIILLIDDEKKKVIEPLLKKEHKKLYDTELNMNGGHITGYHIENETSVKRALKGLLEKSIEKYGEPLLFAVGDGNHSLATAKACYRKSRAKSRYALVEVENIYDDGIVFEPIHRVVDIKNNADFVNELKYIGGNTPAKVFVGDKEEKIYLPDNAIEAVDRVQKLIDKYLAENGGKVDYIHGENDLKVICERTGSVGIVLAAMDKSTLFDYIVKNGVLPRKTFSMGEANEKRYYMECRKIK
jgi:hypothetical protein